MSIFQIRQRSAICFDLGSQLFPSEGFFSKRGAEKCHLGFVLMPRVDAHELFQCNGVSFTDNPFTLRNAIPPHDKINSALRRSFIAAFAK